MHRRSQKARLCIAPPLSDLGEAFPTSYEIEQTHMRECVSTRNAATRKCVFIFFSAFSCFFAARFRPRAASLFSPSRSSLLSYRFLFFSHLFCSMPLLWLFLRVEFRVGLGASSLLRSIDACGLVGQVMRSARFSFQKERRGRRGEETEKKQAKKNEKRPRKLLCDPSPKARG